VTTAQRPLGEYGGRTAKNLLLSGIAAILMAVPVKARSETGTEPSGARPPVASYRIPEKLVFCDEEVPLDREDVRERLEYEFFWFLDRQGLLVQYMKRAARCNPIVEVILEMEQMPADLKYVPVAESGLAFRVISSANAVGYWQFIERTGKRYGLRVDRYVDERRDLTRSTQAAAAYLKDLHAMFGSWTTALAGYNWGEHKVERAIQMQGDDSYYDLYLPQETERYVFRIMALKIIMERPEAYSIYLTEKDLYRLPKVMEVEIKSGTSISVDILADCANVGARTIRVLNPWMRRNILPDGQYVIAVPTEHADGYADRVAKRLAERKRIVHQVKRGENLSKIASKYDVSVEAIEKWNGISRKKALYFGQKLTIWQPK
jgi:hypothetical protein